MYIVLPPLTAIAASSLQLHLALMFAFATLQAILVNKKHTAEEIEQLHSEYRELVWFSRAHKVFRLVSSCCTLMN